MGCRLPRRETSDDPERPAGLLVACSAPPSKGLSAKPIQFGLQLLDTTSLLLGPIAFLKRTFLGLFSAPTLLVGHSLLFFGALPLFGSLSSLFIGLSPRVIPGKRYFLKRAKHPAIGADESQSIFEHLEFHSQPRADMAVHGLDLDKVVATAEKSR
jgi:hypothetical protein